VTGLAACGGAVEATTTRSGFVLLAAFACSGSRAPPSGPYFGFRHRASVLITVVFLVGAVLHALPLMLRQGS